ncbi:MAG: SDR family oxidoreductase [Actinomycetota bacterium]|jgi:NAD(P)-dependent dehydrogenase (short-subunit alcohol dehydrogenase family)|nr:SDR family oxidoreductase [Actinomycetota bacterium]
MVRGEEELDFMDFVARMVPARGSRLVVVGGCGGIGRRIVGAAVECDLDVTVVDLARSIGSNPPPTGVATIECDATSEAGVARAFAEVAKAGPVDSVVNLVGFTKEQVRIEDMSLVEWQEIVDGCLTSAFLVSHHAIPLLRQSTGEGPASLVHTSSTFGVLVRHDGYGPYSASKAAIINLVRALATECAPDVRVNAVAPGLVDTEFLQGGTGRDHKTSRIDRQAVVAGVPLERIGHPDDIASAALFLCSPAASYITAQTLHVNGGIWS